MTFAYPKERARPDQRLHRRHGGPGFASEDLTAKMGMPTANTAMFELTDCAVPAANLLGEEGDGFRIAMGTLVSGRLSVAAGCLGVIEDCLAEAVTLRQGTAAARQGRSRKHQLVQEHIAAIEMDRLATRGAGAAGGRGQGRQRRRARQTPTCAARADLLAAQAKLFAANAAWDAADRAVQVFGGRGWSTLYRPGRHLHGRARLPHLRGDRRDPEAEDRRAPCWARSTRRISDGRPGAPR